MNKALGEIPMTVKLRTGVKDGKNTAHKLMPRLSTEWNVGCITVGYNFSNFLFFIIIFYWFSSMDEQDNSGTRDSPIGITSNSVCWLLGHERQMKTVSFVPRYYIFCYCDLNDIFQYLQYPSSVAAIVSHHRITGRMSKQVV